jgi:hypothetical protein
VYGSGQTLARLTLPPSPAARAGPEPVPDHGSGVVGPPPHPDAQPPELQLQLRHQWWLECQLDELDQLYESRQLRQEFQAWWFQPGWCQP